MRRYLAKKSILFHLICLRKGNDFFPKNSYNQIETVKEENKADFNFQKRIMLIGMSESTHLHAWIEGIAESGIADQVWLFPSDFPVKKYKSSNIGVRQFPFLFFGMFTNLTFRTLDILTNRLWRSYFLYREIRRIKPTHLHFHETQHGAYIFNPIAFHPKVNFKGRLIVSTWGSDLIVYGNTESQRADIKRVMSWTNLLTSERTVDIEIAEKHGFIGEFKAPLYITIGGKFHLNKINKTSERSLVLIKGYQDNHGRALNALESIEKLSLTMNLDKFEFRVFSASESVKLKAELLQEVCGLNIRVLPHMSKIALMKFFEEARVYLGLSISDGLSTSMIEAMSYGAFPIQSRNSAAPDFILDGISGGVVDPWDIKKIVEILGRALTDDDLVNNASTTNIQTLCRKYDWKIGLNKLVHVYD